MAVGCGAKFAKIILIVFNIIFLFTGVILMAFGIWLLVTLTQDYGPGQIFQLAAYGNYSWNLFRSSAILLLSIGCFILFVTIFGLVAAIRESAILLSIYAAILFIVFGGEIAGGVMAIVYKDDIIDGLHKTLKDSISFNGSTYYKNDTADWDQCKSTHIGALWDRVQLWYGCCGIYDGNNKYDDAYSSGRLNLCNATQSAWPGILNVPLTCCSHKKFDNFKSDDQLQYIYDGTYNCTTITGKGCYDKIANWIVRYSPILIGIGIGFGMLELFGFIFVVCLCMNTDKGFKRF